MNEERSFIDRLKEAGPAAVVTSAFIGPGTITTATNAGVDFGYALLWAVVFSGVSLVVIMNMASRIAIIGNKNIIEASTDLLPNSKLWKNFVLGLLALVIGLTALGFSAGNLIGATTGFAEIIPLSTPMAALLMGVGVSIALIFSTPQIVETIMQVFVAVMGIIFVVTAIIVGPDFTALLKGFIPSMPSGSIVNTIALIGTTFIGINLVYHSVASADKWSEEEDLKDSYFDTMMNVALGVLMTLALIITTATVLSGTGVIVDSPMVYVNALEPVLGTWARIFGALGLFFAGLSSSIATAYMAGLIFGRIFGWVEDDVRAKAISIAAIVVGTLFAMFGARPTQIILFAQATSGFFLPFISILFVIAANSKSLGKYKNTVFQNILGAISVVVTLVLGMWTLYNVFF